MNLLSTLLFFTFITFAYSSEEQHALIFSGGSHTVWLENTSEGVIRGLNTATEDQFFFFCERAKGVHKKNCGSWVDKKGNKIKGVTPKVKLTDEGALVSNLVVSDTGRYVRFPENPDPAQAVLERVLFGVIDGPPKAPPVTY